MKTAKEMFEALGYRCVEIGFSIWYESDIEDD